MNPDKHKTKAALSTNAATKRVEFRVPTALLRLFDELYDNRSAALVELMNQAVSGCKSISAHSVIKASNRNTDAKRELCQNALLANFYRCLDSEDICPERFDMLLRLAAKIEQQLHRNDEGGHS